MQRIQHPTNTRVLGAPPGWDQAKLNCGALPVTETTINGEPAFVSYWQPNAAERERLAAGGAVALWVFGSAHPPVAVMAE